MWRFSVLALALGCGFASDADDDDEGDEDQDIACPLGSSTSPAEPVDGLSTGSTAIGFPSASCHSDEWFFSVANSSFGDEPTSVEIQGWSLVTGEALLGE